MKKNLLFFTITQLLFISLGLAGNYGPKSIKKSGNACDVNGKVIPWVNSPCEKMYGTLPGTKANVKVSGGSSGGSGGSSDGSSGGGSTGTGTGSSSDTTNPTGDGSGSGSDTTLPCTDAGDPNCAVVEDNRGPDYK
jgi:hypothetical protein